MKFKWMIGAAGVAVAASLAFVQAQESPPASAPAQAALPNSQPIQFPHNIHAGTYQMDCQYCHF